MFHVKHKNTRYGRVLILKMSKKILQKHLYILCFVICVLIFQ